MVFLSHAQAPKGIVMTSSDLLYVAILIGFFVLIEIAMALMGRHKADRGEHS
jgi:hypothetical protein